MNQDIHKQSPDKDTDRLYENLRSRHGDTNPGANGYRLEQYFLREQEMILSEISDSNNTIVDLACGSGLMVKPLSKDNHLVIGIDFNETACRDAQSNQIKIIRGNVFAIPLADSIADRVINCQFLNQQPQGKAEQLLNEVYRILKPGGRLVLIWRNDRALIHRFAVFIYRYIDKITGRPEFPYYDNYIDDLENYCKNIGFSPVNKFLTFSLLSWKYYKLDSIAAKSLGASCFLVVEK